MRYTFRSETETVYLNSDYQLVILSSNGTSLKDGETTLTAMVRRISDGTEVSFDDLCFTWHRHEFSEEFPSVSGKNLKVTSADLVDGSATFICEFSKEGLFWKDTANISITATTQGANAPYQRIVYICSKDKPKRPSGDSSTLPSGWSLQPPPRTNNWKIWASVGYVTFGADNTPIYSEWSDPVEWTGETAYPVVQWQWGASDVYPPDRISSILVIDGDVMIFTDEEGSFAFTESGEGQWSEKVPDRVDGKPYLWKREYNWQHTSEEDEWFYYPAQGPTGLSGAYQSIGYIIAGTNSVIFAGLDKDKNPTLPTMHVFIEDMSYYFKTITVTLNEKSDAFYLVATLDDSGIGDLQVAYIDFSSDGTTSVTEWKDHETDEVIEDGFVLAEIRMNGADIRSVAVITPRRFDAYEKTRFMEILNSGNLDDINIAAEALGVERVFTKVAALEAFIDVLRANEALITAFKTENFVLETGRMRLRIGMFNNSPIFQADYKNDDGEYETAFQIDVDTGNIFFGQPNTERTAPAHGFMYRASDHTIIGPNENNFKMSSGGNITMRNATVSGSVTATSGTFTGTIYANNGRFSGEVDCDGFKVIPQDASYIPPIYITAGTGGGGQAAYIAKEIYDALYSDGESTDYANINKLHGRIFKCTASGISSTRTISYVYLFVMKSGSLSVTIYVVMIDSLFREIPASALSGSMQNDGMSGSPPTVLAISSIGNPSGFTSDDILAAFDGYYFQPQYSASINIYSDYDNVYLNVIESPTEEILSEMTVGQLYIDSNGFVKAIRLADI